MPDDPYKTLLMGAAILTGLRYWWWQFRSFVQRMYRSATAPAPAAQPSRVVQRVCCLNCKRLVREDLMGWDGSRYICDDCSWLDAV